MRQIGLYRCGAVVALGLSVAVLGGCADVDPAPITSIPQTSSFAPPQYEYHLTAGDSLKIVVLGQDIISGDYEIDPAGNIDLSTIGMVPVAGLTLKELEDRLSQRLVAGGIEQPQVSVLLDTKRPVFISGAVVNPGEYPFRAGMDVRSLITAAGGYGPAANPSLVFVTRAGTSTEAAHPLTTPLSLAPGDTIRIPRG